MVDTANRWMVDCDFRYDMQLQEALKLIEKHGGAIAKFKAEGVGGGNPQLLLRFPTMEAAMKFGIDYFPDDPPPISLDAPAFNREG